jgi:hypothetical protein
LKTPPPSTGSHGTAAGPQSEAAQALAAMAAETAALRQPGGGTVADTLAEWLATRYVIAARRLADEAGDDGLDLATLAKLSADVVALRKGDHSAERLRMERERSEQFMQARFEEWLKQPGMAERICGPKLTPDQKEARLRQLFGLGELPKRGLSAEALAEIEKAAKLL